MGKLKQETQEAHHDTSQNIILEERIEQEILSRA